jgi:hypothetical protein
MRSRRGAGAATTVFDGKGPAPRCSSAMARRWRSTVSRSRTAGRSARRRRRGGCVNNQGRSGSGSVVSNGTLPGGSAAVAVSTTPRHHAAQSTVTATSRRRRRGDLQRRIDGWRVDPDRHDRQLQQLPAVGGGTRTIPVSHVERQHDRREQRPRLSGRWNLQRRHLVRRQLDHQRQPERQQRRRDLETSTA